MLTTGEPFSYGGELPHEVAVDGSPLTRHRCDGPTGELA